MSINLKLEGFEELLKNIEKAGGSINKSCEIAMQKSADIMQNELKTQIQKTDLSNSLADQLPPPIVKGNGNTYTARIGFEATEYNPDNPSAYFNAIFANYGTPSRTKHGKESARGFVQAAKKKAQPQIKKKQEETFKEIMSELKK